MQTQIKDKSALWAVANCKCPHCRQGDMYQYAAFSTKFTKMNPTCPVCNLKFEREPGFFVGAMYVGYAISVAVFTTVVVAIVVLSTVFKFQTSVSMYVISIIIATILMVPFNFRYSRVLMLYWFGGKEVKYSSQATA
jgi:uncharacterized protein (DUF983 family)